MRFIYVQCIVSKIRYFSLYNSFLNFLYTHTHWVIYIFVAVDLLFLLTSLGTDSWTTVTIGTLTVMIHQFRKQGP